MSKRSLDEEANDAQSRWELIESAIGSIPDEGHDWDDDPATWVRTQRRADEGRAN